MTSLAIRRLTHEDIPFADRLRDAEGWNQTHADWQRLLDHQPEGCFLATWNGQPAGTVTTTTHGGDLAWIGMMLVDAEFRRKGIATALMERSLEYLLDQGVRCIKLDATPAGRFVYERLGFRDEWEWQRRERGGEEPADVAVGEPVSFPRYEWDPDAFGADRHEWLGRLATGSRTICRETGFGMLRPGRRAGYLGPVAAADPETAAEIVRELVGDAADGLAGRLFWDIPGPNRDGIALAESLGFRPVRDLIRMWSGSTLLPGQPERQYAIGDGATG